MARTVPSLYRLDVETPHLAALMMRSKTRRKARTGWQALSGSLGERVQLVGDDLFVTNPARIARGVE